MMQTVWSRTKASEFCRKYFRGIGLRFWSDDKGQEMRQSYESWGTRTCIWSCEGDEGCWALEAREGVHKSPLLGMPFSPSGTERTSLVRLNAFKSAMFKEILNTFLQAPSQKHKHFSLRALGGQVRHQKTGKNVNMVSLSKYRGRKEE